MADSGANPAQNPPAPKPDDTKGDEDPATAILRPKKCECAARHLCYAR